MDVPTLTPPLAPTPVPSFCEQFYDDILSIIIDIWEAIRPYLCYCCPDSELPPPPDLLLPPPPPLTRRPSFHRRAFSDPTPSHFTIYPFDPEKPEPMKAHISAILKDSPVDVNELFEFLVFAKLNFNTVTFSEGYSTTSNSRLFKINISSTIPIVLKHIKQRWENLRNTTTFSLACFPNQGYYTINLSSPTA